MEGVITPSLIYLFICDYAFALNTYYNESIQEIQNLRWKKSQEAVEAHKKDCLWLIIFFCNKVINVKSYMNFSI